MNDPHGQRPLHTEPARWMAWMAFVTLWTAALLTTFPITARDAVVSEGIGFSLGKVLHVAAYAVFVVLTARLPLPVPRRWGLLAFVSMHAAATEVLQGFVGRTPSLTDLGLDHLGIALGIGLTWRHWRRARPRG